MRPHRLHKCEALTHIRNIAAEGEADPVRARSEGEGVSSSETAPAAPVQPRSPAPTDRAWQDRHRTLSYTCGDSPPCPPGATEMPEERVERRLAAILAADIAGYSALMGADEARTVRDLKAHQAVVLPMIAQFAGRIIDTAGDGILAEFGSVVNAVECAVAIQETMAKRNADIEA